MKFSYKFSNLLGAVYRRGNLNFSQDGNSVLSPVGNRITIFDLKNNKSQTLPIEAQKNIACVALSPDGILMILVDEDGEALLVSLVSKSVIHRYYFHTPVYSVKFSPDGRKFAVTKENVTLVYHAPGKTREFNPFSLYKSFYGPYDETTCIDWTDNSKVLAIGSKDMTTRVYAVEKLKNLGIYSMSAHKNVVVAAFFEQNSLDLYTLSRDGAINIWECDTDLCDLQPWENQQRPAEQEEERHSSDDEDIVKSKRRKSSHAEEETGKENKILYKRTAKHFFNKEGEFIDLTSADYHKGTHILVTGFASGSFHIHELPEFNLIHSLKISDQRIEAVSFNSTGDWVAFGCSGLGQLLVWEWQSESYVLKQQGHFNNMTCLAYSPDGMHVATGAEDGKVKVWNTSSGFCFVTFSEHTATVSSVIFNSNSNAIVAASLDGTVRAFDLHRYRNFRTFTSPRPAQFASLALDPSGEVVCAGAMDLFEIFVWSMQTGRLLEVLAGHEGPVVGLSFSPTEALLASTSWDKTIKFWDVFEHKGIRETIQLGSDALAVSFRPDGREVAVATLDSQLTFWDVGSAVQTHSIEGRHDLGGGRKDTDLITAKKSSASKSFTTLCYSADGQCLLAGGKSKNVCIYNIEEQLLMRKFEISRNLSFDAMEEFLNRRKMTQFGSSALIDMGEEDTPGQALSLPGVTKGDMSSRFFKPEINVSCLRFSPTGRSWCASTSEGLLLYSLDTDLTFDPYDLAVDVTPESVREALARQEYSAALMLSFRLNQSGLIEETMESIPPGDIDVIVQDLAQAYVDRVLGFVAGRLEASRHLEFYLAWCGKLLVRHGQRLKQRATRLAPTLRALQKSLVKRQDSLGKLCDSNRYMIQYIKSAAKLEASKPTQEESMDIEAEANVDEESDLSEDGTDSSSQALGASYLD